MDIKNKVIFTVNEKIYSVGSDVDSDVSLNDYLRERLNLRGTKYMCKEGGCGSCIVNVSAPEPHSGLPRTFSVNSCLVSVTSCHDWKIKTIEGIGNKNKGYHPIQKTLAEYNGTQCGYCSPGWVMNMYSLLEANNYKLTEKEIENSFGSNTCRCTGYRPILDAFKSFGTDAPKPKEISDIEDLAHICLSKGDNCKEKCKSANEWCVIEKEDDKVMIKINLKDNKVFYKIYEIRDIFRILDQEGYDSYMLINGNTGRGAYPIFEFPKVLIDISSIKELKEHVLDQNLIMGAGTNLSDVMDLFKNLSENFEEFWYLKIFYDHIDLVAHISVRNIASVAGNLMVKYRNHEFSSDIFLLFEVVGAVLTIIDRNGTAIEKSPQEFLNIDMKGRVIVNIKLPPLSKNYSLVTFKIMPRNQNAHAQVNSAYLYKLDQHDKETVLSASIVYGGLSGKFAHAFKTEEFLIGKKLFHDDVLQKVLKVLDSELIVEEIDAEPGPEFRRKLALGLFYKGLLSICTAKMNPRYRSGAIDLKKVRPVSKGSQVFDTNPSIWPINEPTPKIEALIQCAGEANYVNDIIKQPKEVFAAFVTTKVATGEIESIDASKALKYNGVLAFYSAKDIPGINSFLSQKVTSYFAPEEIFCSGLVKYYDQPLGVIVAISEKIANRASHLVEVKYKNMTTPIFTIDDAKKSPTRVNLFFAFPATDRGANIQRIIKGGNDIFGQYHYTMETQQCISRPAEDGLDVFSSTQWIDAIQVGISEALKIDENTINMSVRRIGGAYGCKISRGNLIALACSLVTYLLNRPCRFVMSIEANMRVIGKRPPASSDFEVGVSNSGEIQYLQYNIYEDNGYIVSDQTILYGIAGIKNCYDRRRWSFKVFNATTDTASNTWARAPGNFECIGMTEYIMEQISYELNRDPVDVRLANLSLEDPSINEVITSILKNSEYRKRKQEINEFNKMNRWKKRGIRIALMSWPVTFVSYYNVLLTVYYGDATVVIKHGGIEMGQGINTKVRQVCAYTLNIPVDKIKIKDNDNVSNPQSFTTGGSQTSEAVCFATIKACQLLLDRLAPIRDLIGNGTWEVLIREAYNRGINLQTSYVVQPNDQTPYRVAGAAVAEIELDVLTGEHEIRRVDVHEDTGLSTNPEIDVGQIEGAFIMGVGYWTSEDLIYNKKTGELLTNRSWNYYVPLAKDIPLDFRVNLSRNSFNPIGVLGSKASGEPATCMSICVAFALREAIASSREDTGFPKTQWFHIGCIEADTQSVFMVYRDISPVPNCTKVLDLESATYIYGSLIIITQKDRETLYECINFL